MPLVIDVVRSGHLIWQGAILQCLPTEVVKTEVAGIGIEKLDVDLENTLNLLHDQA